MPKCALLRDTDTVPSLFFRGITASFPYALLLLAKIVYKNLEVYLQQIKKKAKAEGKTCHAKTMLSLEKPIKLL